MAGGELGGRAELQAELEKLGIQTETIEHPEVFTVEEMMKYVSHAPGAHSKNLFLRDKKKKNLWVLTILHNRQVNLGWLAKQVGAGSGGVRFADESIMLEKLGVGQGCVTPLALFNDKKGEIKFLLDADIAEGGHEKIFCHPMTNAASMGMSVQDFLKFVKATGHEPTLIQFEPLV
ncbi:PREDICTED: prolyl-tRNA synthetase associated domain-containing protein 1-like [Branchiostoma belcheri]|uniref:PrdX deacylase domain-containing protein 1 n=1 Tax=Branchiostoma belcheri TaxID=7741 RepID=A0A6P4ZMZ5_BRABE|nr:PREDICTED: prolyl-tRNA synthetase associated domain-containing protein 1-like [Branchiostoma belcheri]KAI8483247.1 Prolyl-tRNA synthetase associated domain-containing protein 1 [Branchiostoma belcheri]